MYKPKILIIDDDKEISFIINRILVKEFNADVDVCNDGKSGLEKIYCNKWDLIITDFQLPNINGMDIIKHCRHIRPDSSILLMTGHASLELTVEAMNYHVNAFIQKPFNNQEFKSKIEEILQLANTNKKVRNILAIGAHPDDVEIGCGGTLMEHHEKGDNIFILTLSKGGCGGDALVRQEEALNAAEQLSARLILKDFEDTRIPESKELIDEIERVIHSVKPDVIYTHSLHDNHQDHRNVHKCTIVAARNICNLSCYQSPSSTIYFEPTMFHDISRFIEKKIEVISLFSSQTQRCGYLRQSLIKSSAEYWGRYTNYRYVEPLEVIRAS